MSSAPSPGRWRRLWARLRGGELSPRRASASVAVGLFVGSLPLYGLHFPLCLAVCLPLRLDVVTAYLAANVSNPFFAPFLVTAEVEVGALITRGQLVEFSVEQARTVGIGGFLLQAAIGSVVVGAALALVGALITRRVVREPSAASRSLGEAVDRTVRRYRSARAGQRIYVAAKLGSDPLTERLAALGEVGDVLDAACGRGQFALLLHELGAARSVRGFDRDAEKVRIAEQAAQGAIELSVGDLRSAELPEVDTVLLLDVLHYLHADEQDRVLARAAAAVRPGGRLVIRDIDAASASSKMALFFERLAVRFGVNAGDRVVARPVSGIAERLNELGFVARVSGAGELMGNRLLVAERRAQTVPSDSSETSASSTSASVSSARPASSATGGAEPVNA